MKMQEVIVGCGIAGAVLARRLAQECKKEVFIIERSHHIGGFCYDERNEDGILIHTYGPHIFRTNNKMVYDYLSQFTTWYDYQHKVLTYVEGHTYPMPVNLDTINGYFHEHFTPQTLEEFYDSQAKPMVSPSNIEEQILSQVGPTIYELFYKGYTKKQWGKEPKELPPEIVKRIPIRTNRDDRYFTSTYQGIPTNGYTKMIQNILDYPGIHLLLNTDFSDIKDSISYDHLYYSGSIDEYYEYRLGKLPYRCVDFSFEKYDMEQYQDVAVVNYPNDYDYTRITEFKHFLPYGKGLPTVIAKEYSHSEGNPSYPIPTAENLALYEEYARLAKEENVTFIGRLGQYRYYSIDDVVASILELSL